MRVAAILLFMFTGACGSAEGRGEAVAEDGSLQGTLTITGSSSLAPLVGEVARRFEVEHPAVRVDVQTGGSSRGVADVTLGLAKMGMISRSLAPGEEDLEAHAVARDGVGVARDGVGIVVHGDNPVPSLTREQVAGIYSGRIRNWTEVGGRPGPITVVNKADGRGTLELFLPYVGLEGRDIRADAVVGDNRHAIKTVEGNRGAVAYVSIGAVEQEVEEGATVRLVPLDGAFPSSKAVERGEYPLVRTLDLVTDPEPDPVVRAFLDFVRSDAVDDLYRGLRLVPAND